MNLPVDYVNLCTKYVDKMSVVSKPDYFPIPSLLINPLKKIFCFMDSPQGCVGGVHKQ